MKQVLKKAPVVFVVVLAAHMLALLFNLYQFITDPLAAFVVQLAWVTLYTFMWYFCCTLKKWAMYGYLGITALNIVLHYFIKDPVDSKLFLDAIFPVDVLFSAVLLLNFKQLK